MSHFIGGPFHFDNGGPDGWWIVCEIDIRFTIHDIVRPDVVGWRRSRLSAPRQARPVDVVPDWVCEVISPSSTRQDRVQKSQLYARHGVPYYWLVDPETAVLEAFMLEGGLWKVIGAYDETARVRIPPFEAVELPVGRLFLPGPPPQP
jgi:Uma2 family endonuclease